MKTILFILLSFLSFSKIIAQLYTEGTPVNQTLMTNLANQLISESGEDASLFIYLPTNAVTGLKNILIIDDITDLNAPSYINNVLIQIGDTVFSSLNNENFNYTSPSLDQIIRYTVKTIGTPTVAYESYPCGEFSSVQTLPTNMVSILFGYYYENITCTVNSIDNTPPPVDSIAVINNNTTGFVSQNLTTIINESLSLQKLDNNFSSLSIYPNPTQNNITINGMNSLEMNELKIFNIMGEMIFTSFTKENKVNIDLSNFTNGIYLLEISNNEGTYREKIIKE